MRRPPLRWWDLLNDPILNSVCKEPCEKKAEHGDANSFALVDKLKKRTDLDRRDMSNCMQNR